MLEFENIKLKHKELFSTYIDEYNFRTHEYAFSNLYFWRYFSNIQIATTHDSLIIKKTEDNKGTFYMSPIGYSSESLKYIIENLKDYNRSIQLNTLVFREVEDTFLDDLKQLYGDDVIFCEERNSFDYIYDTKSLINLSGKKYHSKKNHYNQFIASYDYKIKDLSSLEAQSDAIKAANQWFELKNNNSKVLYHELKGISDFLQHMEELNLLGMGVYVEDKLIAFTIGERLNSETAVIHIEKADTSYKGIYAFINKSFLENYLNDMTYVNREEDLGNEGLRKAKLSYNPIKLEKKYIVELKI